METQLTELSTWRCLKLACATQLTQDQLEQHSETLSQTNKQQKQKQRERRDERWFIKKLQ